MLSCLLDQQGQPLAITVLLTRLAALLLCCFAALVLWCFGALVLHGFHKGVFEPHLAPPVWVSGVTVSKSTQTEIHILWVLDDGS